MSNLILFALASVGLTNILIYGKILEGLREKIRTNVPANVYEVLECYQCTGFWAGLVAGLLVSHNPFIVLMCGFASSFLSETANVVRDYIEANSVVNLPNHPQMPEGEYILNEEALRADLPPHPTAVSNNKLNIFYTSQEIRNETLEIKDQIENTVSFHPLRHQPILPGTVTGTIYIDDIPVQVMSIDQNGVISLSNVGAVSDKKINNVRSGVMDHEVGEILLFLNDFVAPYETIRLVVSYEYNMEG